MDIGILGTGVVGETLATRLVKNGHAVKMGARQAGNGKAVAWAAKAGGRASEGSFADAAAFGAMVFNCTAGMHSVDALLSAGPSNLKGKVLVDVANALDFSKGMPPTLAVANTDSLGEQIQRALPQTKVVKALNTLNTFLMVDPGMLPGAHDLFIAGNDAGAKATVAGFLAKEFGWKPEAILDCGDITASRGTEAILLLWVRLMGHYGHVNFNWHIQAGPAPKG